MRARRHPNSGRPLRGARGGRRPGQGGASRPAGGGLGAGRAPSWPEAGPPPGLGAHRPAADRARPPPLPMAARHRLRAADQRRDRVVSLDRPVEALLRRVARRLRPADRRRARAPHRPRAGQGGWHGPKGLAVPGGITLVFLPPYSPELQPAEHLWPLVDEPIVNQHFATLADLEATIAERCRRLEAAAIKQHTDFHWWPKPIRPN